MYFNNSNNFYHGIMFHHFHDSGVHTKGQGSISKDDFKKLIKFIGRKNILDANIFFTKMKENKLKENEVCFTFDDSIKSQIDVALPVLEEFKIKSFFFVYTSIFEEKPPNLESFRYFRMNYFNSVDDFYVNFYKTLDKDLTKFFTDNDEIIKNKKKLFLHYSIEDIKFRLVRDFFLTKNDYENIMFSMMSEKNFEPKKFYPILFFNKKDLIKLDNLGHLIGLHTHSHPTKLEKFDYDTQKNEYKKCISIIANVLSKPQEYLKWMSHPCGSYNNDTLKILEELGVELGFKQMMTHEPQRGMRSINNSFLEIARQDHADIMKMMS
jgi:peptidoglycan/xylan/chitin deacetylase (PgdA/CDA1 family)